MLQDPRLLTLRLRPKWDDEDDWDEEPDFPIQIRRPFWQAVVLAATPAIVQEGFRFAREWFQRKHAEQNPHLYRSPTQQPDEELETELEGET